MQTVELKVEGMDCDPAQAGPADFRRAIERAGYTVP
jgi:hypothetical protein